MYVQELCDTIMVHWHVTSISDRMLTLRLITPEMLLRR
jgi:hypothetical protein